MNMKTRNDISMICILCSLILLYFSIAISTMYFEPKPVYGTKPNLQPGYHKVGYGIAIDQYGDTIHIVEIHKLNSKYNELKH